MSTDNSDAMTPRDREDLAKLARLRERVAKTAAAQRKAELRADFEQQMATEYAYDADEVWKAATEAANQAVAAAKKMIDARCAELGIPSRFRPTLNMSWYGRGENAVADRRVELRRVATSRLDAMLKEARAQIEARSAVIQTEILAGGLETSAARAFLESMPTPEALMPPLDIKAIQAARGESSRYGPGRYALPGDSDDAEEGAS